MTAYRRSAASAGADVLSMGQPVAIRHRLISIVPPAPQQLSGEGTLAVPFLRYEPSPRCPMIGTVLSRMRIDYRLARNVTINLVG